MSIFEYILIGIGVWHVISSFICHTSNAKSSLMFKVIPFFGGCFCIFYALYVSGVISIR
jgi:hypothetical protein